MADEQNKEIEEIKTEEVVDEIMDEKPEVSEEVPQVEETPAEVTEEVSEEPVVEEPKEEVEESSDNTEVSDEGDKESDKGESDKEEKSDEVVEEIKEEEETPAEPTVDEKLAEAEKRVAEFEAEKAEQESLQKLVQVDRAIEQHLKETEAIVIKSMEEMAKKYNIPIDVSMEELQKQDPTKAAIARDITERARQVMIAKQQEMEQVKEMEAAKVVFSKAEKLFDKFNLNQEQAEVAADTFLAIVKETGVMDLGEDLKNKVELAVAKALMQVPVVMEVHDKIEEVKKEEKADTTVLETPSEKIEEVPEEKVEEKEEVPPTPDLSEFMESATGTTTVENPDAVTSDNVLEKLAALPFRERTEFLRANMDAYNEAMRKRR